MLVTVCAASAACGAASGGTGPHAHVTQRNEVSAHPATLSAPPSASAIPSLAPRSLPQPAASADCGRVAHPAIDPSSRSKLAPLRSGFVSLGHAGGQYVATIRANDIALQHRTGQGAVWIAEHKGVHDGAPGPVLVMHRWTADNPAGTWCFVVADPDGVVLRAGQLEDCVGCHAAAPSKMIFTVPPE